jgi:hypothetical protein
MESENKLIFSAYFPSDPELPGDLTCSIGYSLDPDLTFAVPIFRNEYFGVNKTSSYYRKIFYQRFKPPDGKPYPEALENAGISQTRP